MIESKLLKKLMETFPKRLKSMNYFMLALDGLKDFDIELDLIILIILTMIGKKKNVPLKNRTSSC